MARWKGIRVGILGALAGALLFAAPAAAAPFTVTTTADGDDKSCDSHCTLREAVVAAGSGDEIQVPKGVYVLEMGELALTTDRIVGEGARDVIIDGGGKSRVLWVVEGSNVSGVTIRNGNGAGRAPTGSGGGIYVQSGVLVMTGVAVSGNTATRGGGITAAGTVFLFNSTVSGNVANGGRLTQGGGIASSSSGGIGLANTTVSGNQAVDDVGSASQGGGVYSGGGLSLINATIAGNSAASGGALYVVDPASGSPNSESSVFAGPCAGPGVPGMTGENNVHDSDNCVFKGGGNLLANPRLGALANNGGPTDTRALLPASPAIDHGRGCGTTDQRGVARPQPTGGLCDSGAFEYRAPLLRVVTNVVNDAGGTAAPTAWTVHVRLDGKDVQGSPQPGNDKGSVYALDAGQTYVVAPAGGPPGYDLAIGGDCASKGEVALAEGDTKTCTVTANDVAPTLRVITNVVNDNGGTRVPSNFTARVSGVGSAPGSSTGTVYTLSAGTAYTATADTFAGYAFTYSASCSITPVLGQNATCTITANDVAPTLRVITNVVNDSGGTRVASDFTARVPGVGSAPGSTTGTVYALTAGTAYTVSADALAGYAFTYSAGCSTTPALAQNVTCTITANDVAPTLLVITNVVNDSGGTRAASGFTVRVPGVGSAPGSSVGTDFTLTAGTAYTVTADAVTGYGITYSSACVITPALAQTATCTITANDIAPKLTVITNVVNDSGGTRVPANFTVRVPGVGTASGSSAGTDFTLTAGTAYTITADALTGYAFTYSASCTITPALAQNATCTITANDVAPTLRVITNVVNDSGGTRVPGDFTARVSGVGSAPGSPTGTDYTLSAGTTYTVTADALTGYAFTYSANCSITPALAQNATCTITANDVAPVLTVVTAVVNDGGGTRAPAGFTVRVPGVGSAPGSETGTPYTLTAGTAYTVAADAVAGYAFTYSSGCSGTPALAQSLTCTVTANDVAPTLRVVTTVVNDDLGDLDATEVDVHVRRGGADIDGSPKKGSTTGVDYPVQAGAHDVSAADVRGYAQTRSADCTATFALGQAYTCTITLDDGAPQLTVLTEVVNDDGGTAAPGDFAVSVKRNGADVPNSPAGGSATGTAYSLAAGTYAVSAAGARGYTFATSGDCSGGSVTLAVGDDARTCTVTANDVAPTLTVVTHVVNDDGGAASPATFSVHVRRGGADVAGSPQPGSSSGTTYTLDAGAHAVGADQVARYGLAVGGDCAADGSVALAVGDAKSCTVTADDEPVQVQPFQLPPPEAGETVNARPSGAVKVKPRGTNQFVDLTEPQQLRVGTVVDVRKGRVTLTAAGGQEATFYGGIFKIGQGKGAKPLTTLALVEKLSCPRGRGALAAAKKKKRRLWGDGNGKFRTKGKHSAATVVGTKWLVEDRCASTLTKVTKGRVSVRDFAKKKTVIVRAGKKYVARPKG